MLAGITRLFLLSIHVSAAITSNWAAAVLLFDGALQRLRLICIEYSRFGTQSSGSVVKTQAG